MCLFNLRETIEPGYCFAQGQSLKSPPPSQKGKRLGVVGTNMPHAALLFRRLCPACGGLLLLCSSNQNERIIFSSTRKQAQQPAE